MPGPNAGPSAATSRSRSVRPESERLATMMFAPFGAALAIEAIRASIARTWSATGVSVRSAVATSSGSRTLPTSTTATGHEVSSVGSCSSVKSA